MAVSVKSTLGAVAGVVSSYAASGASANTWYELTSSTSAAIRVVGAILNGGSGGTTWDLGYGAAGSEVAFYTETNLVAYGGVPGVITFTLPVKVPAGTRLAFRQSAATNSFASLQYVLESVVR